MNVNLCAFYKIVPFCISAVHNTVNISAAFALVLLF